MARTKCDACRKSIKANTASVTVNTAETTEHYHTACFVAPETAAKARAA